MRVLFVLAPIPEWLQIEPDKFIALQPTVTALHRFCNLEISAYQSHNSKLVRKISTNGRIFLFIQSTGIMPPF